MPTQGFLSFIILSPKIWAWKEYRIKNIKRDVDELFSILPFEVEFFEGKHRYPIHYVGNPTVDEVTAFLASSSETFDDSLSGQTDFRRNPLLLCWPVAASRKSGKSSRHASCGSSFPDYQLVLAGAPGISPQYYKRYVGGAEREDYLSTRTFPLLRQAEAALVTSGTATLETALFRVPQAVCYHTPIGKVIAFLKRHILKVKYHFPGQSHSQPGGGERAGCRYHDGRAGTLGAEPHFVR